MKVRMKMIKADLKNTLIIVPVYNSGWHIEELLKRIFAISEEINVLCIDDGSRDNSLYVIKKYHEKNENVRYLELGINRGKGYALKTGFIYANEHGFDFALTLDSDLQHDPAFIPNFIKTQNVENADLVIGFRKFGRRWKKDNFTSYSEKKMPLPRIFSNSITSGIVSIMTKQQIYDSQSGYRLYNLKLFAKDEIKTDKYQMETEILINYIKKKAIIAQTEISVIYNREMSYISHMRDIVNFVNVIVREL